MNPVERNLKAHFPFLALHEEQELHIATKYWQVATSHGNLRGALLAITAMRAESGSEAARIEDLEKRKYWIGIP